MADHIVTLCIPDYGCPVSFPITGSITPEDAAKAAAHILNSGYLMVREGKETEGLTHYIDLEIKQGRTTRVNNPEDHFE